MASKKKKSPLKHKKITVKKHKAHKVSEEKALEKKQVQMQEAQETVPSEAQAPVAPSEPTPAAETNPLGSSPVVGGAWDVPESNKEQESQVQSQSPGTFQSHPDQQPSDQNKDIQTPQPESSTAEPVGKITQDPLTTSGVVRDKVEQDAGEQNIDEPKNKRLWMVIAIVAIIFVLVGGSLWYFRENVMKKVTVQKDITPVPTISKVSPAPASDSAKMTIDYAKYKIKVLNGSGISGVAGKTKDILEGEKFLVEEIGNAETSDYENTVIRAKKEVPKEFLDSLKKALEESYILDPNEKLDDSEDVDVIIIVGSSKQP